MARPVGIKICGLTEPVGLDACVRHGVNWVGFVFHPASPRYVTPENAAMLSGLAPDVSAGGPRRVGLLVKPDDDLVVAVCRVLKPDILQIYDTPARVAAVAARAGLPVWAAIGVDAVSDLPLTTQADGLVIEAKPSRGTDRPGGNGLTFDWSVLGGWTAPAPWLLAGGLTPDNAAEALARSGAVALDVSSGVEVAPGRKSPILIERFVEAARSARHPLA